MPIKPKGVELFNPLDGEAALFASSIIHLLESSLVVYPFTKMRNVARDVAVVDVGAARNSWGQQISAMGASRAAGADKMHFFAAGFTQLRLHASDATE